MKLNVSALLLFLVSDRVYLSHARLRGARSLNGVSPVSVSGQICSGFAPLESSPQESFNAIKTAQLSDDWDEWCKKKGKFVTAESIAWIIEPAPDGSDETTIYSIPPQLVTASVSNDTLHFDLSRSLTTVNGTAGVIVQIPKDRATSLTLVGQAYEELIWLNSGFDSLTSIQNEGFRSELHVNLTSPNTVTYKSEAVGGVTSIESTSLIDLDIRSFDEDISIRGDIKSGSINGVGSSILIEGRVEGLTLKGFNDTVLINDSTGRGCSGVAIPRIPSALLPSDYITMGGTCETTSKSARAIGLHPCASNTSLASGDIVCTVGKHEETWLFSDFACGCTIEPFPLADRDRKNLTSKLELDGADLGNFNLSLS